MTQDTSDTESPGLSACDICYQRKIKCDRKSPCANCVDSRVKCLRQRQKQQRKPRENVSSKLNETKQQMEARIASLESVITGLVNPSKTQGNGEARSRAVSVGSQSRTPDLDHSPEPTISSMNSGKRKHDESSSEGKLQSSPQKKWSSYPAESYSTPPFSAIEAQNMIQQELNQGGKLSKQKREAFHSALGSLSDSLRTSYQNNGSTPTVVYQHNHEQERSLVPTIPDIETMHWLLNPNRQSMLLWALPDSLPILSRPEIVQMTLDVQDANFRRDNPAAVVCICSITGHFLLEQLMTARGAKNGLERKLQERIAAYFATARAATSQISLLAPPSLQTLKALIFGALNAQEAGHAVESWTLITAACNVAIALNLHKKTHAFTNSSPEILEQAEYCLFACYAFDKGLAMNLGKPPTLSDAYIEVDLRQLIRKRPYDNSCRYTLERYIVEFALVQSSIIDLQLGKSKLQSHELHQKVAQILEEIDYVWKVINDLPYPEDIPEGELDIEIVMGRFSLYTTKTVLLHTCTDDYKSIYNDQLLESARASMEEMRKMKDLQAQQNDYKILSFAHWTVLFYPFTSFFVLFNNVISKKYVPDYELMLAFVEYLNGVKFASTPITKLYNLCRPFCALASTALKSTEESQIKGVTNAQNHKRIKTTRTGKPSPLSQSTNSIPQDPITQMEEQMIPQQGFIPPTEFLNNNATFDLSDDVLSQFMDFQPTMQWLDTDLSAFEQSWGQGFNYGQDGTFYPSFQ